MENTHKPKLTPRDFFLWLGAMVTLYVSAISLITLLFQYINILFPDEFYGYIDPFSGQIRFAIASLIIIFPLYIYFTRKVNADIRRNPEKQELGIRKWFIFITLFVAGATLVGDLIALVNTFLGGELTTRFVLKVAAIFVVIGGAFVYYWQDIRGTWMKREKESQLIGALAVLVVLATLIAGFAIVGSPAKQRDLRLDQERVADLQTIQYQILNYWQNTERLPETLDDVADPLVGAQIPRDPDTDDPYEYTRLGDLSFELCATFALGSDEYPGSQAERFGASLAKPYGFVESDWEHEAGRNCFKRTIDPERFNKEMGLINERIF